MNKVKQYLALCWLKASPLDLPTSVAFFKRNLAVNFVVFFFIQFNMTDEIESISEVFFETALSLALIAVILLLNRNFDTYLQVMTSILFVENVAAVCITPIMFWATVAEDWFSYGTLSIFLFWNLCMIAAIFKKVLAINSAAGFAMAVFYMLTSFGGGFALNSVVTG